MRQIFNVNCEVDKTLFIGIFGDKRRNFWFTFLAVSMLLQNLEKNGLKDENEKSLALKKGFSWSFYANSLANSIFEFFQTTNKQKKVKVDDGKFSSQIPCLHPHTVIHLKMVFIETNLLLKNVVLDVSKDDKEKLITLKHISQWSFINLD